MKYSSFEKDFTIRLHETDLGGIVHHSNYFHWIEETEYAFFAALGEPVVGELDEHGLGTGWPRCEMKVKFIRPLHFRDSVCVKLHIKRIRSAGLEYAVSIYRLADKGEQLVLQGSYVTMCCLYDSSGLQDPKPIPIPEKFLAKIAADKDVVV